MKDCAWKDCSVKFEPKTHNQIYCSDECCRTATNYKIMQKYYAKKARKNGEMRTCSRCGRETLSRFNDVDVCSMCRSTEERGKMDVVKKRISNIQW